MLALSFQKTNIAGFAWIAPALILFIARGENGFRLGYLAGLAHYLISLSWLLKISESLQGPAKFYPVLGWIALAAYLALYPAAWGWIVSSRELRISTWRTRTARALFAAAAWVTLEMIVARMFSGFPWNLLGASQHKLLPLIQIASCSGVYGVSFLVVWLSASLLNVFDSWLAQPSARHVWLKELALPIFVVALVYAFGLHQIRAASPAARTLRIALVQPSIPQTMIWNESDSGRRFVELLQLTEAALTNKPDLVIWPEAAVPTQVRKDKSVAEVIAQLAIRNNAWFIIGSDDSDRRGTNDIYFNSSFLVSPRGEFISTYRKRRLVIFGEYVPLADWLPFIKYLTPITGGFTAGERPVTFDLGELSVKTSVLICFEDVFPHYAREHATNEIDFLVNITNDGWFGESSAQWQHAANAAFRTIENGVPLVRCANNGVSCWIDLFGGMNDVFFDNSRDVYRAGFKIISVPIAAAEEKSRRTFYNRYGDVFGWSCVGVTTFVLLLTKFASRRRKSVHRNSRV